MLWNANDPLLESFIQTGSTTRTRRRVQRRTQASSADPANKPTKAGPKPSDVIQATLESLSDADDDDDDDDDDEGGQQCCELCPRYAGTDTCAIAVHQMRIK